MTEKQTVFLIIVDRFLNIWREASGDKPKGDIRQHFTRVKIMKLLYFFCMLDEKGEIRKPDLFNRFVAYPFGPVNEESYNFLKSESGNECFERLCKNEKLSLTLEPVREDYIEHVFSIKINSGENKINIWEKLTKMPVDELVELSHQTDAWREAYLYSSEHNMDIETHWEEDREKIINFLINWEVA